MLLFSQSIATAVDGMLRARQDGRTLVTLPSYPAPFTLAIAHRLTELAKIHCAHLQIKIALNTLRDWTPDEQKTARAHDWNDTRGNLTYYRNSLNANGKSLVVLCGADKVTDTAGLEAFTFCDEQFLWKTRRKDLFQDWLTSRFADAGLEVPKDDAMIRVEDLLASLRILPSGGLLKMSQWLDDMDMTGVQSGKELLLRLLNKLDMFDLPNCQGFAGSKARKNFSQYAKAAQPFFEYASLIRSRDRAAARKAVTVALELLEQDDPRMRSLADTPEAICPGYASGEDFLRGLLRYIDNEDPEERKKLRACDFVFLHDKVLRCRKTESRTPKEKPKKLYGPLLESLLSSLWYTLAAYSKKSNELGYIKPGYLLLSGESYAFAHEGSSQDKSLSAEVCARAHEQLGHLLDGIDQVVEVYLGTGEENFPQVRSQLLTDTLKKEATRKTPNFCFAVQVAESAGAEALFTAHFSWVIPEKHGDRLNAELVRRAADDTKENTEPFLPVYHLAYYEEMLLAPDDEDTREIVRHSLRDGGDAPFAQNLLEGDWGSRDDPLLKSLKSLAKEYTAFVRHAADTSLVRAIHLKDGYSVTPWKSLKGAYEEALQKGRDQAALGTSDLVSMLMRAFLVINRPQPEQGDSWRISGYEPSAIVTALHPALLEQMEARTVFLCASFRYVCKQALSKEKPVFLPRFWHRYISMAKMHAPLCTLLRTPDKRLASELRGDGYIHKIGHIEHPQANTLATRLHSEGARFQEKLSDTDLYEESDESMLLDRLLQQYYDLRPHAWDGISLAIFRNTSIQPVIAGLHAFLQRLEKDPQHGLATRATPYDVRLVFFSKSNDATDLRVWLTHWQSRWEAARNDDTETTNSCYRHCQISVSHRLVRTSEDMEAMLRQSRLDVDIALLYGILDLSEIHSHFVDIENFDLTTMHLKFPILEKKYCPSRQERAKLTRSRIISRRQFSIASLHAGLLHALHTKDAHSKSSLVISTGDFTVWKDAIAALHKAAEWVICIDPVMDEALIRDSAPSRHERDIIAFGSGVGSHGEANYTISSEQLSCQDLRAHISSRLATLYGGHAPDTATCDTMAGNLLRAEKLAGMALIRAASLRDRHIHDFLAYSLSRRLLQAPDAICDAMISLDAYRHWFPSSEENRPDLLWITGEERNGRFHLHAALIECKLGRADDSLVWKAHTQLRSGLNLLEPLFRPSQLNELDDTRPDRRYWWHQLHRVITSGLYAEKEAEALQLAGWLEQLAEGQFSMEWEALLLTYWTDDDDVQARWTDRWNINGIPARQCVIGRPLQIRLALEEESPEFWTSFQSQDQAQDGEDRYPDPFDPIPAAPAVDATPAEDESAQDGYDGEDDDDVPDWDRNYLPPSALEGVPPLTPEQEEAFESFWNQDDEDTGDDGPDSPTGDGSAQPGPTATADGGPSSDGTPDGQDSTLCAVADKGAGDGGASITLSSTPVPEQILLGKDKSGRDIHWRFRDALNRHLVIFGSSGNGKTYAIQCLLAELARQGLNTLVLDYSQSFAPNEILPPVSRYFPEERQHFVFDQPLPLNPLTRQPLQYGNRYFDESPLNVADRITDIFKKVFNLGTQQVNTLRDAVTSCLQDNKATTLLDVEMMLDTFREDGRHTKSAVDTLQSHVHNFVLTNPFTAPRDTAGWERVYGATPACNHVFQLANIAPLFAAGIIEFVLWDLFFHVQRGNTPATPRVVVLDEIQNLSMQSGSPVDKILREGRKFGIGLIAATQSFAGIKSSLSLLNQAAYKLYFRPADNEMSECGKQLHDVDSSLSAAAWKERLTRLRRGECFIVGPATAQERPVRFVKIASMEERGFGQ